MSEKKLELSWAEELNNHILFYVISNGFPCIYLITSGRIIVLQLGTYFIVGLSLKEEDVGL
jgi:hypothetical protein